MSSNCRLAPTGPYSLVVRLDEDSAKNLDQESASVTLTSVSKTETLDGEIIDVEAFQKLSGEFVALKVYCKNRDLTLEATDLPVKEDRPVKSWWLYFWVVVAGVSGFLGLRLLDTGLIEAIDLAPFFIFGLGMILLSSSCSIFYLLSDYKNEIKVWEQFVKVE